MSRGEPAGDRCPLCGNDFDGSMSTLPDGNGHKWHKECARDALCLFGSLRISRYVDGSAMDAGEFRARQAAARLNNPGIARTLEVSLPAVEKWRSGRNPIPATVAILVRILSPSPVRKGAAGTRWASRAKGKIKGTPNY